MIKVVKSIIWKKKNFARFYAKNFTKLCLNNKIIIKKIIKKKEIKEIKCKNSF